MKKNIVQKKQASTKSKLQTKYENLLKEIEKNKVFQTNMEEGIRTAIPKIQKELYPLIKEKNQMFRKRLLRLDELADEIGLGKYNKEWFDDYMVEMASNILDESGFADHEIKNIYEKYANEPHGPDEEEVAVMKSMVQEQLGVEIDIEELLNSGIEEYMKNNQERIFEQIKEKKISDFEEEYANPQMNKPKKKTKEQESIEQDAKAIYMRLMKKFHPDLEQDETKKALKTTIIQNVTKAYQDNDFLALLQLQIEHIDEGEADATFLAEDMLKRYNKILQKQLNEIKMELQVLKMQSGGVVDQFFDHQNKFSENKFNRTKKEYKEEIEGIEIDIRDSFKRKKGWFKEWIQEIKSYQQESMMKDMFFQIFNH